jgi:hypothetical protein
VYHFLSSRVSACCLEAVLLSWAKRLLPETIVFYFCSTCIQDRAELYAGLATLRMLVRKYEFRDQDDRRPMADMVDTTFPPLLSIFQVASPFYSLISHFLGLLMDGKIDICGAESLWGTHGKPVARVVNATFPPLPSIFQVASRLCCPSSR